MRSLLRMGLWLALIPSICGAAFEELDSGARFTAMAGALCGLSNDCQTVVVNPAGLSLIPSLQLGAFHARPFGMTELAYSNLSLAQSTPLGGIGACLSSLGTEPYQEFLGLLGYGRLLGRLAIGANLKLMRLQIADHGSANSFGVDLGLLGSPTDGLNLGISATNINSPQLAGDDLPSSLTTGFALSPAKSLVLCGDVRKELGRGLETRLGTEYVLGNYLALRSGFRTDPPSFSFGAGILWGGFEFSYGGKTHTALGVTHSASMFYSLKPRRSLEVFRFPATVK